MRTLPARSASTSRRGVVLLFSIAVLAVLAILGATFASISRVERNVSRNYVDHVRSQMLATAGVEVAIARLSREVRDPALLLKHRFFGEDMNENGLPDPGEDVNGNGWEEARCPLVRAPHPSYMADLDGNARLDARDLLDVEGRRVGATGVLPSTYTPRGDFYSVKVIDASSLINVNMTAHPHLQRLLENLCEEAGLGRSVGTRLHQNRPYRSLLEIRDRCRLDDRQFEAIKGLVTVYGWFDKEVVDAVPLARRIRPGLAVGSYVYTWEEIRPRRIDFPRDARREVVGRCPVNVNLAPREVLVALLRDLSGFYLDERETRTVGVDNGYMLMDVAYAYAGASGALGRIRATQPVSRVQAHLVADAILARRRRAPITSWQEMNEFLHDEVWERGLLDLQQVDALKANFNPNSNVNDFNPEMHRFQWVDKTDLTYWTTELTFAPTGYYRIESVGRVMNQLRGIVAEAELLVDAKLFDLHRQSTQRDFLHDVWKEDASLRDTVISRERGAGRTAGGLALASFPELPERDWVRDADWDGYLTLATRESDGAGAAFHATYSANGLEADSGHARIMDRNGPFVDRLVDRRSGSGGWRPGKLFPDGVYAELDSVPMYQYTPSDPHDIYASFWLKPHFFPEHAGRTRVFMTWQRPTGHTFIPMAPLGVYGTVTSFVEEHSVGGYDYQEPWDTPALLAGGGVAGWEGAVATPCLNHEGHGHDTIQRAGENWETVMRAGKWMHVAWVHDGKPWEGRQAEIGNFHENLDSLYVNGRKVSGVFAYQQGDNFHPVQHDGEPLRLGARRDEMRLNTVPDSTIDEVLIWEGVTWPQAEARILDEFNDGRFYNDDDGTFTSRAIDLAAELGLPRGTPVTLSTVSWTQFVPESLPDGAITVELVRARDRSPLPGSRTYAASSMEKVDLVVKEPFRYVVRFRPGVGGTSPVVDTLVFDDITLAVTKGPQFLSWAWVSR